MSKRIPIAVGTKDTPHLRLLQSAPYDQIPVDEGEAPEGWKFFRVLALRADIPNANGDYFPTEELLADEAYKSFIGQYFIMRHRQVDKEAIRGKIFDAVFVSGVDPVLHKEGKWVEVLVGVDANKYEGLVGDIESGERDVSMGCLCYAAECNICGHKVYTDWDLPCEHIAFYKGHKYHGKPVYEIVRKPRFVELSHVEEGADEAAKVLERVAQKPKEEEGIVVVALNALASRFGLKVIKDEPDQKPILAQLEEEYHRLLREGDYQEANLLLPHLVEIRNHHTSSPREEPEKAVVEAYIEPVKTVPQGLKITANRRCGAFPRSSCSGFKSSTDKGCLYDNKDYPCGLTIRGIDMTKGQSGSKKVYAQEDIEFMLDEAIVNEDYDSALTLLEYLPEESVQVEALEFPEPKFENCVKHFVGDPNFKPEHAGDTKEEAATKLCAYIKRKKYGQNLATLAFTKGKGALYFMIRRLAQDDEGAYERKYKEPQFEIADASKVVDQFLSQHKFDEGTDVTDAFKKYCNEYKISDELEDGAVKVLQDRGYKCEHPGKEEASKQAWTIEQKNLPAEEHKSRVDKLEAYEKQIGRKLTQEEAEDLYGQYGRGPTERTKGLKPTIEKGGQVEVTALEFPEPRFENCVKHFVANPPKGGWSGTGTEEEQAEKLCAYIKRRKYGEVRVVAYSIPIQDRVYPDMKAADASVPEGHQPGEFGWVPAEMGGKVDPKEKILLLNKTLFALRRRKVEPEVRFYRTGPKSVAWTLYYPGAKEREIKVVGTTPFYRIKGRELKREAQVDASIENALMEFKRVQAEVTKLNHELENLETKRKELIAQVRPVMLELEGQMAEAGGCIFKYSAWQKQTVSWKTLFDTLVTKVNRQTVNLMDKTREELTNITEVEKITIVGGILEDIFNRIKGWFTDLVSSLRDTINQLRNLETSYEETPALEVAIAKKAQFQSGQEVMAYHCQTGQEMGAVVDEVLPDGYSLTFADGVKCKVSQEEVLMQAGKAQRFWFKKAQEGDGEEKGFGPAKTEDIEAKAKPKVKEMVEGGETDVDEIFEKLKEIPLLVKKDTIKKWVEEFSGEKPEEKKEEGGGVTEEALRIDKVREAMAKQYLLSRPKRLDPQAFIAELQRLKGLTDEEFQKVVTGRKPSILGTDIQAPLIRATVSKPLTGEEGGLGLSFSVIGRGGKKVNRS